MTPDTRRRPSVVGGRRLARAGARRAGTRLEHSSRQFRRHLTRGLTVFVFHEVTETPSEFQRRSDGYVSPAVFARQLDWIASRFQFVAPDDLPALGGRRPLPENGALLTFDDAWAGVFHHALPMLDSRGVPALCLLNMATVAGDPDLGAVRRYQSVKPSADRPSLDRRIDAAAAPRLLAAIRDSYGADPEFRRFQGPTARSDDLAAAAKLPRVWFGSHLYHHWDLRQIAPELREESLRQNAQALKPFPNALPALATPYGNDDREIIAALSPSTRDDIRLLLVATGRQNRTPQPSILDRLILPPEPSTEDEWWYATHRKRLLGRLAS